MEQIMNRVSVRRFLPHPIEEYKIEQLLYAAMQAPSAGNQQPWEFLVLTDSEKIQALSNFSRYAKPLVGAPVGIVLLANLQKLKYLQYWQQDMGACCENLLLEAVHLGLGGVWLGVAPMEERMRYIRRMFNIPETVAPFAVVALGYPQQEVVAEPRFDPRRVHYEFYAEKQLYSDDDDE